MPTYTINEVCKQYELPSSTLRYYERIGLLSDVAQENGHRIYTRKHLDRLNSILCFKNSGMTIKELQDLLQYQETGTDLDQILIILKEHKTKVEAQLAQLKQYQQHITQKVAYYSDIKAAEQSHTTLPDWNDYKPAYEI
jgi:DNA-binding transcriptional MerR regulator